MSCLVAVGVRGAGGSSPPITSRSEDGGGGGGNSSESTGVSSRLSRAVRAMVPACKLAIRSVEGLEFRLGTFGLGLGLVAGGGARLNCGGDVSELGESIPSATPRASSGDTRAVSGPFPCHGGPDAPDRGNEYVLFPSSTIFGLPRSVRLRVRSKVLEGDFDGESERLIEDRLNEDMCGSSGITSLVDDLCTCRNSN